LNRKNESVNPFDKIDTQIETQTVYVEEIKKKISDMKEKLKKELGKLDDMKDSRIVEIVHYSGISDDMLRQLVLAAAAENSSAPSYTVNDRKEVETNEDDETE